jgi:hypothetical protein
MNRGTVDRRQWTGERGQITDNSIDLMHLGRVIWADLPLLMVINLLATLAGTVVMGVALAVAVLGPVVAALLMGPVWIGAIAISRCILGGEAAGVRDLALLMRRYARTGIGLAMLPATVAAILIASAGIRSANPDDRWLMLPIIIDALVLVVLSLGAILAFPLAIMTGVRGRDCWVAALALAGRNLLATLGVAALIVLLALSARFLGPMLLLIAAGPLAVLCTATTHGALQGNPTIDRRTR